MYLGPTGWCRLGGAGLILVFSFLFSLTAQNVAAKPEVRGAEGGEVFASRCSGCHGSDGRGGEHAPNIATVSVVRQISDSDLSHIIENGIPGAGMPAFGFIGRKAISATVGYLRELQGLGSTVNLPGDPHRGELLFTGKAQCSTCHMINGKGGFLGSELSFYGAGQPPQAIRAVILDPEKNLPRRSNTAMIVTKDGKTLEGLLRTEDNFDLSLQSADGAFHFLKRSDLTQINIDVHSLMPTNYGSALSDSEVNDLVSFLIITGNQRASHQVKGSSKADDDKD
jgi:cytochrome c oxidase cbb3-type subunit III